MAAGLVLLCGCEARQLFIAHDTKIGIHAAVKPDMQSGYIEIGYDRYFVTVLPRSVELDKADPKLGAAGNIPPTLPTGTTGPAKEAMSVVACTLVEVDTIFLTKFVENIATGRAARAYAGRVGEQDLPFNCFK